MNAQHLLAFLWLRWRLLVNQTERGGIANVIVMWMMAISGVLLALFTTSGAFVAGLFAFEKASPPMFMYVWDGLVLTFCFAWAIGLLTELQRSESLALEKFLHLPVSLSGVFVLNYVSSLFSLNLVFFVPMMAGLSLGLAFARGPAMLLLLPLVAAFVLMVTALTYQFQGWLSSLMVNKRRRKTVLVLVTLAFVLVAQVPMLINVFRPWETLKQVDPELQKEKDELKSAFEKGEINQGEFDKQTLEWHRRNVVRLTDRHQAIVQQIELAAWIANLVVPLGWLPFGAMELADGNLWPALAGSLAMSLLGAGSLWRAYRTTVRMYTGQFTAGQKLSQTVPPPTPAKTDKPPDRFLEKRLPWLSEPAAVIALGGFRSLMRAPEAKMLFLSPIFLLIAWGCIFFRVPIDIPTLVRPLAAFGSMSILLFTTAQFVGNQFGFDRDGFRVFVLSPVPRRDILLGKNLAMAPIAFALCSTVVVLLEIIYPLRFDHLVALVPHWLSMYLLFCMSMNLMSILVPMQMPQGSLKPAKSKLVPSLVRMLFVFLLPPVLLPTLIPLGIEAAVDLLGGIEAPIYLVLSLAECAGIICLYRLVLIWEGNLLQAHEQAILHTVTTKVE